MGPGERYQEVDPPEALRPWVRTIWTYAAPEPSPTVQRIAPDGCPELILHLGVPYEEQSDDGMFHPQPSAVFAGQMTRPLALRPAGPVELCAVRFHPDGARDWLAAPLASATDRRLDMTARLASLRLPRGDPDEQARRLGDWLEEERQGRSGWTVDPRVRAEVRALEEGLETAARDPAGHRALQRAFLDRVGVSPRLLRSIFRFRRVFDHAHDPDAAIGWLEAGLAAGYFDQPQLARDFRRFLGCTATAWAREQVELARSLASQSYKTVVGEAP
ncbi:helix-turn-helix domain-containing protein [Brevundimonas sp.]|uniref:AraC family transcriptional regulator n=1 Tax=Brevundimonas sp. TaxID=1871086 RepID=UPI002E128619|nr:helix-turn-helix domain-containing protein [Brevundimonas sp.]